MDINKLQDELSVLEDQIKYKDKDLTDHGKELLLTAIRQVFEYLNYLNGIE